MLKIWGAAAICQPTCRGNETELSCLFCPVQCGLCSDLGHIDHCYQPGTVHLSIDDGPNEYYPFILKTLKENNVSASFWVIGVNIEQFPDTMKEIHKAGHFIGSHSWSHLHSNMVPETEQGKQKILQEFQKPNNIIYELTGQNSTYLRPPYGEASKFVEETLKTNGYTLVFWNLDATDWLGNITLLQKTIDNALSGFDPRTNSFIILMHLYNEVGLCSLKSLIDRIRFRGYEFVSAEDCWNPQNVNLSAPIYKSYPLEQRNKLLENKINATTQCNQKVFSRVTDLGCSETVACLVPFQCCPKANDTLFPDGPMCTAKKVACAPENCLSGYCDVCVPTYLYPFLYNTSQIPPWTCEQVVFRHSQKDAFDKTLVAVSALCGVLFITCIGYSSARLCQWCRSKKGGTPESDRDTDESAEFTSPGSPNKTKQVSPPPVPGLVTIE
jgi:peptidoglycan/xylan/chitin deacetylase (PgdA/CDA1 family)